MPYELRLTNYSAKSGREREAYGFCDHRRRLTRPVRNGSDHFGRRAGMEQTPGADEAPNGLCLPVRCLAMGAASEVFQPEALAGQEVRVSNDFADVIPLGGGRVALVMGDTGSKEQGVAMCVPQALRSLRLILSECTHPACALGQLNHYLCGLNLRPAGPGVALSLAVVDVAAGTAVCACAGSEPPLILRADGGMEAVNAGRIALGVAAGRTFSGSGLPPGGRGRLADGDGRDHGDRASIRRQEQGHSLLRGNGAAGAKCLPCGRPAGADGAGGAGWGEGVRRRHPPQ